MLAQVTKPERSMPCAHVTDQTQLGRGNGFYYKYYFTLSDDYIQFFREDQKVLVIHKFKVRAPQTIKV